jgi:hypothetical protein
MMEPANEFPKGDIIGDILDAVVSMFWRRRVVEGHKRPRGSLKEEKKEDNSSQREEPAHVAGERLGNVALRPGNGKSLLKPVINSHNILNADFHVTAKAGFRQRRKIRRFSENYFCVIF